MPSRQGNGKDWLRLCLYRKIDAQWMLWLLKTEGLTDAPTLDLFSYKGPVI